MKSNSNKLQLIWLVLILIGGSISLVSLFVRSGDWLQPLLLVIGSGCLLSAIYLVGMLLGDG